MSSNRHFFIQGVKNKLFASHYKPLNNAKNEAFIICHPFAEEKKFTQKFLVDLSVELSNTGYDVLLFDFNGCGDSEGHLRESTITSWINDLEIVKNFIQRYIKIDQINFVGLRFGTFIGLKAIQKKIEFRKLILIEPVFDVIKHFKELIKNKFIRDLVADKLVKSSTKEFTDNLENKRPVDFEGFEISPNFYTDLVENQRTFNQNEIASRKVKICLCKIWVINKENYEIKKFLESTRKFNGEISCKYLKSLPFWNNNGITDLIEIKKQIVQVCNDL